MNNTTHIHTTHPLRRALKPLAGSIAALLLCAAPAFAGSATWLFAPATGDWNTAGNWTPATEPNGAADVATFHLSTITSVSLSADTEVDGIVFNAGASAFTITVPENAAFLNLTVSGTGITNNSGITQNFVAAGDEVSGSTFWGFIDFHNNATAGINTLFTVEGGSTGSGGGEIDFNETSTAGSGTFVIHGGTVGGGQGGQINFNDTSTAGDATLIANGGTGGGDGGFIQFNGDSTGGRAIVKVYGNGNLTISTHNAPGVTIGSLEGDGLVFLGARNLTVGSNNRSTTFSGVIQDTGTGGSLTKIGTGTLRLTGNNDYRGGTYIKSGYLAVGSDHALGHGDVFLEVGILGTYNGPRAINVERNYVQLGAEVNGMYTGGTLRLGLGGAGPGQSDRLVVKGTATLAGTLDLVRLNGYNPKRGDKFALVTAGGGVSGKFVEVNNPFEKTGTIVTGDVFYEPNAVFFEAVQGSFAGLGGLTPNQKAVARNLDRVVWDHRADKLIAFLDAEPLGALRHDFDKIAPEELASVFNIGVSLANVQRANLERRMGDIQAGLAGFSASGYTVNGGVEAGYGSGETNYGARGPGGKGGKELMPPSENRWGVFVTGVGEFTNIGNTSNARGYDLTTGGFTLGADYKITPNFAIGINAGYARTGAELTGNGRVTVDGAKAGIYATYFTGTGFYADAAVSGGYNSYDTRRSAIKGTARGSTNGGELNALFATGYDWKTGGLTVGPTAGVQYTNMGLTSFREHGSLAPLRFKDQFAESLRTALGLKASYDWQTAGGVVIRPEVRAAWQHEFDDTAFAIDSRLASGAGKNFTVTGPGIGDDSLLVGAGVAVLWNERTSTYVYYDGELFRSNYSSNNVSGGVRLSF